MAKKPVSRNEGQQAGLNNPSTQMDKQNNDNDFPGYPHYDKKEDIMDGRSDTERVNIDVEGLPSFHNATTAHRLNNNIEQGAGDNATTGDNEMDTDLGIEMGTEADVTAEEKKMLEDDMYLPTQDEDRLRQARLDDTDFDGEKLNENSFGSGQAESGDDLDMGGDESSDDAMEQGDEENQYFSLGGDKEDTVEGTQE